MGQDTDQDQLIGSIHAPIMLITTRNGVVLRGLGVGGGFVRAPDGYRLVTRREGNGWVIETRPLNAD
jgi:hypothetical protein